MLPQESKHSALTPRMLLIEDNEADATLVKIVHDDKIPWSSLDIVNGGPEAILYLSGEGKYRDAGRPDLILMDMYLPMSSDLELIADITALAGCELIPIVIISGSEDPAKLQQAYRLGANCVIRKSSTFQDYFWKLARCFEFWCRIAELPCETSGRSAPH
jgi:CheY-like chemotaxis protein